MSKKEHDERQKKDQTQRLRLHVEEDQPKIGVGCQCSLCSKVYTEYARHEDEVEEVRASVVKQLYEDGWRYATSTVFALIGPMCGECYAKKDDDEAWED